MATKFRWEGFDAAGTPQKGTTEAETQGQLTSWLHERGINVMNVEPQGARTILDHSRKRIDPEDAPRTYVPPPWDSPREGNVRPPPPPQAPIAPPAAPQAAPAEKAPPAPQESSWKDDLRTGINAVLDVRAEYIRATSPAKKGKKSTADAAANAAAGELVDDIVVDSLREVFRAVLRKRLKQG